MCLVEFGGERLYLCVDCDLDFEEFVNKWFKGVIDGLSEVKGYSVLVVVLVEVFVGILLYLRINFFKVEVFENLNLNGCGLNKEM